ncbi:Serine/threonine-protein kinase ICK [Capsicum annuum]|nr:Serine/threonine-protein kinase ICK [Capsicum annuum]KAF3646437.1 Serine/threonine-protein kinase ICK [Capsicum annuum]
MNRFNCIKLYRILKELGDGTCGNVYKAINTETSEILKRSPISCLSSISDLVNFFKNLTGCWGEKSEVAVKKMKRKFYFWEECINLREIKSLRKLNHPNIIKLKEIVRENNELFFILEYMECNLYQLMKERQRPFLEEEIRGLMSQVLQGLAHMHKNGYFHRDLKPENLLVTNDVIKIADFGLAREVSSLPPFTDYVSTRWYRAPEVLLQSSSYTPAIDMWAVGAVLAELFTLCPIFPGESEIDQLYKICCVLGPPDWTSFTEPRSASRLFDISCFDITPANLSDVIPNSSLEAIDLIKVDMWIPRPLGDPLQMNLSNVGTEPNLELNLWNFGTEKDDCYLGLTLAVNPSPSCLDLFPAKMASKSQGTGTDMLFCPGFQDHSQQSGSSYAFPSSVISCCINHFCNWGGWFYNCLVLRLLKEMLQVFWSLFPTDHQQISAPVDSTLSLSFRCCIPILYIIFSNVEVGNPLVNKSAKLSLERTCRTSISPFFWSSYV